VINRIKLFFNIVFRSWEEKGIIPEPYRSKYRISPRMAWRVTGIIWGH